MTKAGDNCEQSECSGRLAVYATRINFAKQIRIRYLRCGACGHLPDANKWIVPLLYAPQKPRNLVASNGKPRVEGQ